MVKVFVGNGQILNINHTIANVNFDADISDNNLCEYDSVQGCTDVTACNYDPSAEQNNGTCSYPPSGTDCFGNCTGGTAYPKEVPCHLLTSANLSKCSINSII